LGGRELGGGGEKNGAAMTGRLLTRQYKIPKEEEIRGKLGAKEKQLQEPPFPFTETSVE